MRLLFWLIALCSVAVGLAIAAYYNHGYVLIIYPPKRIDLSLNMFVLLLALGFVLAYLGVRITVHTLRLPDKVRAYRLRRSRGKARSAMQQALTAFFEGRYGAAEKAAASALALQEHPALSAVVAARSAHQLRQFARRDEYLEQVDAANPEGSLLKLLTKAELLLGEQRVTEALEVLRSLRTITPKSAAAMRLELKAHTLAKNWDQALTLTAQLDKLGALDAAQAAQMRLSAYLGNLNRKAHDPRALQAYWEQMPTTEKINPLVAGAAARFFMALGGCYQAHTIIEQALERHWDTSLAALYGNCLGQNVLRQIERAEGWLKTHPYDAALLFTLGKLCTHQALWGKAQSYLEASLGLAPTREAHVALAELLEKLGRADEANRHYRQGLEYAGNALWERREQNISSLTEPPLNARKSERI